MSIIAYTGLPGHGKSYSVVENVVIPCLKQGRIICHNLTLYEPALRVVAGEGGQLVQIPRDATPDEVVSLCTPGAIIILDEVWRYWGAGLKASDVPTPQLAFFKEHRHRVGSDGKSSEIVIIDQELGSGVSRFIRDLVELTYIHQKHSTVGMAGSFRVDVYGRAQNATKPSKGALIRKMQGRYKSEVWNCYVSHTQKENAIGEAGLEIMADARGSLLRSWPVKLAVLGALILPVILWNSFRSFNDIAIKKEPDKMSASTQNDVGETQVSPTPQRGDTRQRAKPALAPVEKVESDRWTLRGIVEQDGLKYAIVEALSGFRRLSIEHCKRDLVEWTCKIDGEIVAEWTGSVWQKAAQAETFVP